MAEHTVHVLEIHHAHGVNITVHKTISGAELMLIAYVTENWAEEMDGASMPDALEAINAYFECVQDREWYEISETELQA